MKYILTLKNGETREAEILPEPLYRVEFMGDASSHYRTMRQIKAEIKRVWQYHEDDPFRISVPRVGAVRDEGDLFAVYDRLRNPIMKLERVY